MALIKCKDCAKEFSTDAKACPNCGSKPPRKRTNPLWYLAVLFIMGAPMFFNIDDGAGPSQQQILDQRQSALNQDAAEGAAAIKQAMRNPESFVIAAVVHNTQSNMICYEYRAENGFGGMNTEHAILKSNREFIYEASGGFSKTWTKECNGPYAEAVSVGIVNAIIKD